MIRLPNWQQHSPVANVPQQFLYERIWWKAPVYTSTEAWDKALHLWRPWQSEHRMCSSPPIFFFLLGATTLVEPWPSQQFLSIWGDLGLVLSILWVSSSSGRSWHRLPIGTCVFLLVFLWMVSIYSQTSVHELNSFLKVVRKPKCS